MLSNHDFPRLATRLGEAAAPAAAMLLLTLPGTAFVYQGEEIGMVNGSYERPSTASGATASATRCSGSRPPAAASARASPGWR